MTYTTDGEYDDERADAALRAIAGRCPDLAAEATRALLVNGAPRQMRLDRLIPAALESGRLSEEERALLVSLVGIGRVSDPLPAERRTSVVQIRLTPSERDQLDEAAEAVGMSVSELIRSTMFATSDRECDI